MWKPLKEFIIGIQPSPVTLTDNSELKELVLLTERIEKIELLSQQLEGDEALSAILLDDGKIDLRVRDNIIPPSKGQGNDNDDTETPSPNAQEKRTLDMTHSPFFKNLAMQQTCYSASDQPHLHWRRITYLKLESYDGKSIVVGTLRNTSESKKGKYVILPVETVNGPCMMTGIGMHNTDIMALQILSGGSKDSLNGPSNAKRIEEHLYAYGKSSIGLVNLKPEGGFNKIEQTNFVGLEDCDPNVLGTISKLYNFMAGWWSSRSAIHRIYPDLYSLIDRSIADNNRSIIFSTFRLERHMRYRIQNSLEGHAFDRDPFLRIKLFQVIHALAMTLERCQRIIVHKPTIDCYCIGYLSGDFTNLLIANMVLVTQLGLTYVLFCSIWTNESGTEYFPLREETVIITPIIAIFSAMLVWKQISNIWAIKNAYPGMAKSLMGFYEFVANFFLGIAILVIQILLLSKQDNRLEYVLNSVAAIFILELDDTCVFLDDDGINDLHLGLLVEDFQKRVQSIDNTFFQHMNWKIARNYLQLHSNTCSISPLPEVKIVDESEDNIIDDSNNLKPVTISFDRKHSADSSGGWIEIASSQPIVSTKHLKDSKAHIQFTWRDQGVGNRKGRLRVRLLNVLTDEDVASSPEYGDAPHEIASVEQSFDLNHGLVRHGAAGYRYVVEILVGGGGGHELYVHNFEFTSSPCFVVAAEDSTQSALTGVNVEIDDEFNPDE